MLHAYGWADLGPVPWADEAARATWTETLLERLVALNARRAAEEATGTVRWLRPEYQDPARRAQAAAAPEPVPEQASLEGRPEPPDAADTPDDDAKPALPAAAVAAQPWPSTLPEQVRAVAQVLSNSPAPLRLGQLEAAFKGKGLWKKGLPRILETLEALGRASQGAAGWRA